MPQSTQISAFGSILLFLVLGTAFVSITLLMSKIISPKKPNPEKLTTYECGEEPIGNSWTQFNMRFYVIALVFLLFDVELIFLFPWSTVFGNKELIAAVPSWGWLSFFEMTIFIGILLIGLVYVWKKGDLNWVKPQPLIPAVDSKIPVSYYQQINQEVYKIRAFVFEPAVLPSPTKEVPLAEKTERRQYVPKTAVKIEMPDVKEEITQSDEKPAYQPKFKPKTVISTDTKVENVKSESKTDESVEKPAYKPKFRPQTVQTSTEKTETKEEKAAEKPAYVPKFKPRAATATEAPEIKEDVKPVEETKTEKPAKAAYVPKFKPRMAAANNELTAEETTVTAENKDQPTTEEPPKSAYVPKFKPRMVQKTVEDQVSPPAEITESTDKPVEEKPAEENNEQETKPSAYKPRFKPTMVKKQNPEENDQQ